MHDYKVNKNKTQAVKLRKTLLNEVTYFWHNKYRNMKDNKTNCIYDVHVLGRVYCLMSPTSKRIYNGVLKNINMS